MRWAINPQALSLGGCNTPVLRKHLHGNHMHVISYHHNHTC
jgi:hypothetical protein